MDHFGIGAAIKGAVNIYLLSARRTGRTTSLVESVKDGDRICFRDSKEAEHVRRLCRKRGVNVECIVLDPKEPHQIFNREKCQGRTLFDHSWIEHFYLSAIERATAEIDLMEKNTSGYAGIRPYNQRREAEISKWLIE